MRPPPNRRVGDREEIAGRGVAKRTDLGLGAMEVGESVAVSGMLQRAGCAGDDDDLELVVGRQQDGVAREVATVQQHGMAGAAGDRGELVEQPGRHTTRRVLCGLTQPGESDRITGVGTERQRARHFEGCARRQPDTDRKRRGDAAGTTEGRTNLLDHAGDVRAPMPARPSTDRTRRRGPSQDAARCRW